MRASPPCHVLLSRFGVWHAAIATVCALGAGALWAWSLASQPLSGSPVLLAGVVVLLAAVACGASLARARPVALRWDGQAWFLIPQGVEGREPGRGELTVSIDFGSWMLLRFAPDGARNRFAATWLPAQRRGLEGQWHALRCAAFAPRPHAREPVPTSRP